MQTIKIVLLFAVILFAKTGWAGHYFEGRVWYDNTCDGVFIKGQDAKAANIYVEVRSCADDSRRNYTWTDANGYFVFSSAGNIPTGETYRVCFPQLPPGYVFGPQHTPTATDTNYVSSVDPTSKCSPCFSFLEDSLDTLNNAALCQSTCPGSIGDFIWNDLNGDGCQDADEPGIPNVKIDLYSGECGDVSTFLLTTNTSSTGHYSFDGLCPGNYQVVITPPTGYLPTQAGNSCPVNPNLPADRNQTDSKCEGTAACGICVTLTDSTPTNWNVDCGFVLPECQLTVSKSCYVEPAPAKIFVCSDAKPINSVSMIWNGSEPIGIKAWKGAVGSTLLATINNIAIGQKVTVTGYAGAPNDVIWEIFNAANSKLGESTFHLSCSDADMNGPEDCGKATGNGKNNSASYINSWLFAGLAGNGQVLDCNPTPLEPSPNCTVTLTPVAGCDTVGKPTSLTFRYTGDGCAASDNLQDGKATCSGAIDPESPVAVATSNSGYTILPAIVQPGESFTVSASKFAAQSDFSLSNGGGKENLSIHTSCSKPLAVGDVFGSLTLVAFNNQTLGGDVIYRYTVVNIGQTVLNNVYLTDDKLGNIAGPFSLQPGESRDFDVLVNISETTTNIATATVEGECQANSGPVVVTVITPPCAPTGGALSVKDKKLSWPFTNNGTSKTTLNEVKLTWPASNGKLTKVFLDKEIVWDKKLPAGSTSVTLTSSDLIKDAKKRSIDKGKSKTLIFEFEKNAATTLASYTVRVTFDTCVIEIADTEPNTQ